MSITDELREYADRLSDEAARKSEHGFSPVAMKLEGIADHIDAEHERAMADAELAAAPTEAQLEEWGYVKLPVDAEGKPIRIGDVMEWVRYKDDDPTIVRTVSGIGNSVFFAWSDEQGRYAQYEAHAYRHHHAPTVEDVLREFTDEVWNRCCEGATASDSGIDELVAECAAKLRLAGENA